MSLSGCAAEQASISEQSEGQVLIELQYGGGAAPANLIPKLQVLDRGFARLHSGGATSEIELPQAQFKELLADANDPAFMELNSDTLLKRTRTLMLEQGGPIPRIMDASTPEISIWTGESYHSVSFYAPRVFLRHSGENPELQVIVELLTQLETILSSFPKD
jgi:hypothetical protein